jgi:hypothetical protein
MHLALQEKPQAKAAKQEKQARAGAMPWGPAPKGRRQVVLQRMALP